jgi:hypothetical protein
MTDVGHGYEDAIKALPQEAVLGQLCFYSIKMADVQITTAKDAFARLGLEDLLPPVIRPVDAFRRATRAIQKKHHVGGVEVTFMVKSVGSSMTSVWHDVILERATTEGGTRKTLSYGKVAELTFERGYKQAGQYWHSSVGSTFVHDQEKFPLSDEEETIVREGLKSFTETYERNLNYLDSNAVRTVLRMYLDRFAAVRVRESGGIYFVAQTYGSDLTKVGEWVTSIGSEFHMIPLLNLGEQRDLIAKSFQEESLSEAQTLMAEISTILGDPERKISDKTYDQYSQRAALLFQRVDEYAALLGSRSETAAQAVTLLKLQTLNLTSHLR